MNVVPDELKRCIAPNNTADTDHFSLIGLPRQFDLDESDLRRRFLEQSRSVHPDALASESSDVQSAGMLMAARINEAYETLRDPTRRAEYLLQLCGGKTAAQDKRVPQKVLNQSLTQREDIDEARAAGDQKALADIRENLMRQKKAADSRIARLARRIVASPSETDRDELRLELNSIKYLTNLLAQT